MSPTFLERDVVSKWAHITTNKKQATTDTLNHIF